MNTWLRFAAFGLLSIAALDAGAQEVAQSTCSLPAPMFVSVQANIFNDRQEQDLGDALAEFEEPDVHLLPEGAAGSDEMTRVGEKLLAALPATGVHYRFRVYESGEVNGFSLAGGRVYISRKLIAAVKNEDELAGVLAHEIGHLSTHQTAVELTRTFRLRLGIVKVTDRADIFAKVHLLLSTPAKPEEEQNTEKSDQLLADRVALYAMVRAGYSPQSFISFMDESMMNKGKTGNWLTDAFGLTHEESQRYRTALKLISVLPQGCRAAPPSSGDIFLAWQRRMVEEHGKTEANVTSDDKRIRLDTPLRPSLWRIRFSPDGRFVLAQDEGGIALVDHAAAKVLFRIDAPNVEAAQFTPDSQAVVFKDSKLRVERWEIATGKRSAVKELVIYDGCDRSLLTPDGNTLVCANIRRSNGLSRVDLKLMDVESGKPILDRPAFYQTGALGPNFQSMLLLAESIGGSGVPKMVISPDGHTLLVTALDSVLAFDLVQRQAMELGGKLKGLSQTRMSFLGPDELFVVGDLKGNGLFKTQTLSFPDGRLLQEGVIGDQGIEAVSKGRRLLAGPLKDYPVAILDPEKQKFVAESKFAAMDAWDSFLAMEDGVGGLLLSRFDGSARQQIVLPMSPLPELRAAAFSSDGKYLAASLRNLGELWDLKTGKKLALLRPFRSAWMDEQDRLFAQLPKFLDKERTTIEVTSSPIATQDLGAYADDEWQYRDLLIHFKPMGKDGGADTTHRVKLEVRRMGSPAVAWSRDFPKEAPACWPAEDDRLVLAWDLSADAAKAEIKSHPALQAEAAALKKRGLLLETVSFATGTPLEQVILPVADLTHGYEDVRRATVSGGFALVKGEHGNTAIYRLKDAEKVGEFFGKAIASDAGSGLVAALHGEQEILLVDENTGKELQRYPLDSPFRMAQIVPGKDGLLLVLAADQVVHRLPLPQLTQP